jgi:hypothetical protein
MAVNTVAPFTNQPPEPLANPKGKYPHVVVCLMCAVYKRESIAIRQGVPSVLIDNRRSYVQHPAPYADDGHLSDGCRKLLLDGVLEAVVRTTHRMCVVWAPGLCSYVERDVQINDSNEAPSGGVGLPNQIAFDVSVPLNLKR